MWRYDTSPEAILQILVQNVNFCFTEENEGYESNFNLEKTKLGHSHSTESIYINFRDHESTT